MLAVDFAGGYYLLGTVIAFSAVTPMAYLLHCRFTFAEPVRLKAFIRFVGGVATTYPVATGMMIVLCSGLHLSVAVATPIATAAVFAWNFIAVHWAILPRLSLSPTITVEHRPTGADRW
jgi:putative flippase GtrA